MEIFPVIKCYPNKDTKRRAFCRKLPLKGSPNCGPACERSEGKSFPRVFEQLMPLISTGSLRGVRISQSAVRGKQSGTFAQLHVVFAYTTFEDQKGRQLNLCVGLSMFGRQLHRGPKQRQSMKETHSNMLYMEREISFRSPEISNFVRFFPSTKKATKRFLYQNRYAFVKAKVISEQSRHL